MLGYIILFLEVIYNPACHVLNPLKFVKVVLTCPYEEVIAISKFAKN